MRKLIFIIWLVFIFSTLQAQDWKLINTKYPTSDDVVAAFSVADFGAKGDGVTDVTKIFQDRLNILGSSKGGTLFVPEGKYVIKGSLVIPKGVTLRGEWKKPVKGEPIAGTILMAYNGSGVEDESLALITLESSAAVMDLAIWYPQQSFSNIQKFPPAILLGHQGFWGNDYANAKNITIVNAYSGVILSRNNGGGCPVIYGIYGTPLSRGIEIDNIADVGRIDGVDFSPEYWRGSGLPNSPDATSAYKNWIYNNGTAIVMRRNDWSYACNVNVEGYSIGFHAAVSIASAGATPNGHNYGMNFTGCKTGVLIEATNGVGIMFAKVNITNCEKGIEMAPNTSGVVQFHSCYLNTSKSAIYIDSTSSTKFSFLQSVVESGDVVLDGGTVTFTDCDFNNNAPQIVLKNKSRGIITGNRFSKGVKITNSSILASIIDHAPVGVKKMPDFPMDNIYESHKPQRLVLYNAALSPYKAKPTNSDNTVAIQSALDQAALDGGGVVFLPPGKYKVLGNLTVPSGVELKGSVDVSTAPMGPGSVLEVYADKGNPAGNPFMKLAANSGLRGIVFNYPEQLFSLAPNVPTYPYTVQVTGSNVYIVNVGFRAAYSAIDLFTYQCDNHYLDYVTGHMFKTGIKVGGNSVGGKICNFQFNPTVYGCGSESKWGSWPNSGTKNFEAGPFLWDNLDFMVLGDCSNELLYNNFHYCSHRGIVLTSDEGNGPTGLALGLGIDASRNAMVFESIGKGGFDFINTQIVSFGDNTKYIELASSFSSDVTFFNSDYWGNPVKGIVVAGGAINLQSANFEAPGQTGFASISSGKLNIENSFINYNGKPLLNSGAESSLTAQWSIIDPTGINKEYCALWNNNLSMSPTFSTESSISRSGWVVSASNNSGSASKAIDNDGNTRWDTGSFQMPNEWYSVKFSQKEKINKVILDYAGSSGDGPDSYELYVSDNGKDWYGSFSPGKGTSSMLIIDFPTTTTQYLRFKQTGSKASSYWSIHEIYVYGEAEPVSVSGISIDLMQLSLNINETKQLSATITPENAENKKLVWVSSKPKVVTVDPTGLVKGISNGTADITVVSIDGVYKSTSTVTVGNVDVGVDFIEENKDFNFDIYPNPVSKELFVRGQIVSNQNVNADIFNSNGVKVKSVLLNCQEGNIDGVIHVGDLKPGYYFIRLSGRDFIHNQKVVVE